MSTKIIQLEFPFERSTLPKTFEESARGSIKALFAGHNEIVKANREIKSFHDFLLFHLLETQDALLAMSDRIDKMEQSTFEIKTP